MKVAFSFASLNLNYIVQKKKTDKCNVRCFKNKGYLKCFNVETGLLMPPTY